MRFFLIIASIITILTSQARAQAWMEYNYPDFGFAVSFPTDPTVESVPYKTTNGTALGEIMYSVQQEASVYSVTVIDFSSASVEEATAMDQAVKALRENGDVKLDIPARVNRNRGRQLSIIGKDGSHSTVAIFLADHRLYQIQGTVLAWNPDPISGDGIRFQQSLRFTGGNLGPNIGGNGFGRRQRRPPTQPN
jgi:hypothetical protein